MSDTRILAPRSIADLDGLVRDDRDHLIHSTISWRDHEERGPTILESGSGAFVTDSAGLTLLDGFSGLWCVNLGYGIQSIVDAASRQMSELPYATGYFHFASRPAIALAAKLAALAPGNLNHVFFTLGGSDAVDSAVRFIRFYFNVLGLPEKKHFIALDRGYHGSSSVGAGLTGLAAFHTNFDAPLPTQHHIATPYPYRSYLSPDELVAASVRELEAKVEEIGAGRVAAFIVEPVIGSGGVIVPPDGWLMAMRTACRELGILFVADEVITGFGRTGPMFGCDHDGVVPDIMTLAKGLTSGYCPMGAVLLSDEIFRTIADNGRGVIGHGLTYSGHPVSAAVALEVLRLYDEGGYLERSRPVGQHFGERLRALVDHPLVGDVRSRGLLGAIELVVDKGTKRCASPTVDLPGHVARLAYQNGLICRAFPDGIVGFAPPLCCGCDEIDMLADRLDRTLGQLLELPQIRSELC